MNKSVKVTPTVQNTGDPDAVCHPRDNVALRFEPFKGMYENSSLESSPGRGHQVIIVFLRKTLYFHSASLHPGVFKRI